MIQSPIQQNIEPNKQLKSVPITQYQIKPNASQKIQTPQPKIQSDTKSQEKQSQQQKTKSPEQQKERSMDLYRKVVPVRVPDDEQRVGALGSLAGEQFRIQKAILGILPLFEPFPMQGPGEWLYQNEVDGQTFPIYASIPINYLNSTKNTIYIGQLDCSAGQKQIQMVKKFAKVFFPGTNVKGLKIQFPNQTAMGQFQSEYFDYSLFDGSQILKHFETLIPNNCYCLLTLTDHYIYNLPNEKVFGLGAIQDRTGIVSYQRFFDPPAQKEDLLKLKESIGNNDKIEQKKVESNEKPKLSQDERKRLVQLTQEKVKELAKFDETEITKNLIKVVNHEICHMFGIRHCIYYKCLMNGSSYDAKRFDDMIEKPFELCPICIRQLQHNMQFDILERYQNIAAFCDTITDDPSFDQIQILYQNLINSVESQLTIAQQ